MSETKPPPIADNSSSAAATTSKPRPRPAHSLHRPNPLEYFVPSRRQIQELLRRENILGFLRTMAWVVPLTILIWVYAEREQLAPAPGHVIPIDVKTSAPNRVVKLESPADRNIVADLAGPRAQLDEVLNIISRPGESDRIRLDIDPSLGPGRYPISSARIADNPLFKGRGVSVFNCQPQYLMIRVDEVVGKEIPVRVQSNVTNLDGAPAFDPPTVHVQGPRAKLEELEIKGQLLVTANLSGRDSLKTPGSHEEKALPLILPNDSDLTFTPTAVNATFKVKQTEDKLDYPSMSIFVNTPLTLGDRYRVELQGDLTDDPFVRNVTLIGPTDVISALRREDFKPKPVARLTITNDDLPAGTTRTRELKYDLPENVRVSPEDARRTVEFKLVEIK